MLILLNYLNTRVKNVLQDSGFLNEVIEIRLRINSPVLIKTLKRELFLDEKIIITKKDIDDILGNLTKNSIHAFENEINKGYITLEGGHRVGISGDCIYDKEELKGFKNITSLNIRIAKEFPGCSNKSIKHLITPDKNIYNTLIIGPPLSGKTTLIRDVARNLSDGFKAPYFEGCDVTLIDERGEISAVYNGIPQMNTGRRTDVLSYCRKSDGFFMSIRALSPKVIISDELGSVEDFEIVQYALKSGVKIVTTAHGFSLDDVKRNLYLRNILNDNFFERAIILNKRPLRVNEVFDFQKNRVIYNDMD
ncbi:MAG TPA: stage III sporulation protein AA [Clostridiales bacterium]|jgi:stage III sporulation protein AA|nr:stage III sporulation protein AA [Clostridiales bacterium]HCS11792.1 stage III sporulation protein AA [Clostridiales bacterium]